MSAPTAEEIFGPESVDVPSSWRLLDDVELLELPSPQFIIQNILQQRGVGVIYSPPGTGKTTLISALATSTAAGLDFFGHPVLRPGPSVCVTAEDPQGFKERVRAAKLAAHLPLNKAIGIYTFPEPIDMRDPASIVRFERFLMQQEWSAPLAAIFVDTYAASTPGANENSAEDVTMTMVHAQRWRDRTGATVTFAHHTNASGNRERGHTAMRGAADFMISLTPVDDMVHVECSKQRNAAPFERFTLKLTPGTDGRGCVFRLASDVLPSTTLTPAQAKVLSVLRDTFGPAGATKTEWQKTCAEVPERTFYHCTKVLQEKDYVKANGSHFRVTPKGVQA